MMYKLWWDFNLTTDAIVIESTHPKYLVIATLQIKDTTDADPEVELTEGIIREIETGRISYKRAVERDDPREEGSK